MEVYRAYQIIPDGLFISKKPCIGKPSDEFLDSWEGELQNRGVNLREVLIKGYMRQLFRLITQFKPTINKQIVQEDWTFREIGEKVKT